MLQLGGGSHLVPKTKPHKYDSKATWFQNQDSIVVRLIGLPSKLLILN
jgi:hypothetical protein